MNKFDVVDYFVVYHRSDLDGMMSGAIVKMYLEEMKGVTKVNMIGLDYGDEFKEKELFKNSDTVYFVDFMLQPIERMKWLNENCNLNVLDHHDNAIKEAEANGILVIKGKDKYESACKVVWEHLIDSECPEFINLLSAHDTWDKRDVDKWDNVIEPFQYAMRVDNYQPNTKDGYENCYKWFDTIGTGNNDMQDKINDFVKLGEQILKYQKKQFEEMMDNRGFEMELFGKRALCMNTDGKGSGVFMSKWNPDKHDFMFSFGNVKNEMWNLGFYTEKKDIDCCAMAKKFKGGGHVGASGAAVNTDTMIKILNGEYNK
jgi:oligoribonuclease NrnB/cAMP/cGMP phosphodiesterase (DHH superfamily)